MSKKAESTNVQDDIYEKGKIPALKIVALFLVVLAFTILSNLSISGKVTSAIESGMDSMRGCPISHSGVELSWFFPKVTIKSPELSPKCFGKRNGRPLALRNIPISLSFPSVYPPGLKVHVELKKKRSKSKINIYPTLSFGKNLIRIKDTTLEQDILTDILGRELIRGSLSVESVIELVGGAPTAGDVLIKSTNLKVPMQNLNGLTIPELKINNLQFKGSLSKSKLKVVSLLIGDETSPIVANFKGTIRVNKYNFQNSRLNLSGEVKFSQELLTAFPIINMLTTGKENQGGFYKIKLTGKINAPKPQIL